MVLLRLAAVVLRPVQRIDLLSDEPGQVAGPATVRAGSAACARSVLGLLGKPERVVADDTVGVRAGEHPVEDAQAEVVLEVRIEAYLHEVAVPDPVEHGPVAGRGRMLGISAGM